MKGYYKFSYVPIFFVGTIIKKSCPVEKVIYSTNFTVLSLLFHNFDSNSYYKLALSCIFLTSIDLHYILYFNKFFTICSSSSTVQNTKYAKFILILISNLRNFLPVLSTGRNTSLISISFDFLSKHL